MARPTPTFATIIPAFNEERTLARVLASLRAVTGLSELLVVSDGSTDATTAIARDEGVVVLELPANQGKGRAMAAGLAATAAPVVLFVDGDVLDLDPAAIDRLVAPVLRGDAAMSIGVRDRGRWLNALQRVWGPRLSGIRCLRREVFEAVPRAYVAGFTIETALNHVCARAGWPVAVQVLRGLRHLVKEKKRGLWHGTLARVHMFHTVFAAWLRLTLTRPELPVLSSSAHGAPELSSDP